MARPTLADFKQKALNIPEVRKEYENLSLPYQIKKKLIAIRKSVVTVQQPDITANTKESRSSSKISAIEQYEERPFMNEQSFVRPGL